MIGRGRVPRAALVAAVLADPAPILVIEAPAGTGKSWLMQDLATALSAPLCTDVSATGIAAGTSAAPVILWDIPAVPLSGPVPESGRMILAKRPETAVPGLARAEVYGRVIRLPAEALLFEPDEIGPAAFARSGGWACLLPHVRQAPGPAGDDALVAFLYGDILQGLGPAQIVAFDIAVRGGGGDLPGTAFIGVPFLEQGTGPLPAPLQACSPALRLALARRLQDLRADPQAARAVAAAQIAFGRVPEAIGTYQGIAAWGAARKTLADGNGVFFVHRYGPEAFDAVMSGFPAHMLAEDELLVHCRAIQAAKVGDTALSRAVLAARYGADVVDVAKVLAAPGRYPRELRFIRFLLATWEDFPIDDATVAAAYALLNTLSVDDHLRRGSFHNAVLEVYMRQRRYAEANDAAARAARHYAQVDVPILSFYIDLHRAIIQLSLGQPVEAAGFAQGAAQSLARLRFDGPGDVRLLELLRACIDYEGGQAAPLARFLSTDIDEFAHGELWPTLLEMMLIYGSQALGEHVSTMAARTFLGRWRGTSAVSGQFRRLIDIREVIVLQNANRWQEAAQLALGLSDRISPDWVVAAGERLGRMDNRDDVALTLVWLRHFAWSEPKRAGLEQLLAVMADNPHITGRQRTGVLIWRAHVLRRQKRSAESLALLTATLVQAAAQCAVAILSEERGFLNDLIEPRRVREALDRAEGVRRILRQVQATGPGRTRRAREHGLTRQEMRVLHGLREGSANKGIAKMLDLSEATVKFHLANLYRKLGCASRRDAVAAAMTLGLID